MQEDESKKPEHPGDQPESSGSLPDDETAEFSFGASGSQSLADFRLRPGQQLGRFRIERPLGRGGMGEVYEALDQDRGHRVALKVLSAQLLASANERKRFLREGLLAASINHPHSLYVYGTEEIDGNPVIIMEMAPGGTLEDRLASEGPLSILDAVDAVIQIIDGLDAAAQAGVLHRDIKPANCFVDQNGDVKVADYGLAISTGHQDDSKLTAAGTFLGTPAFASPEQLRGGTLDVRSDIYSVGATLYSLLVNRHPFEGVQGVSLLAAILEQAPVSPEKIRPEIPRRLGELILRCLEKDPSRRFQDYATLRGSLIDFSSRRVPTRTLGRRIGAGILDVTLALPLSLISLSVLSLTGGQGWLLELVELGIALLYSGATETFGATLGKLVFGLRVVGPGGGRPGLRRALLRAMLYWGVPALPLIVALVVTRLPATDMSTATDSRMVLAHIAKVILFLLLFLTIRRSNGWFAVHDRLTGTHVVPRVQASNRSTVVVADGGEEIWTGPEIGPYTTRAGSTISAGSLIRGYDPRLHREIWIDVNPDGSPELSTNRKRLSRSGRLRWVNKGRSERLSWNAFQTVGGEPFLSAIRSPQPWSVVRRWLCRLSEEIMQSDEDDTRPDLGLDRIWIAGDGRALLLDFAAPGAAQTDERSANESDGTFLKRMAMAALSGSLDVEGGHEAHYDPPPLRAVQFLRHLDRPSFGIDDIVAETRALLLPAGEVKTFNVALRLFLVGSLPIFTALVFLFGLPQFNRAVVAALDLYPNFALVEDSLRRVCSLEDVERPTEEELRELEDLKVLLAGPLRESIPDSTLSIHGREVHPLRSKLRARARTLLADQPAPSEERIRSAREHRASFLDQPRSIEPRVPVLQTTAFFVFGYFTLTFPLMVLFGALFRGGILLRVFGLALVNKRGEESSRRRAMFRSLIVWSPILAGVLCSALLWTLGEGESRSLVSWVRFALRFSFQSPVVSVALGLFAAGLLWTLVSPKRALQDRLAGTFLVPR